VYINKTYFKPYHLIHLSEAKRVKSHLICSHPLFLLHLLPFFFHPICLVWITEKGIYSFYYFYTISTFQFPVSSCLPGILYYLGYFMCLFHLILNSYALLSMLVTSILFTWANCLLTWHISWSPISYLRIPLLIQSLSNFSSILLKNVILNHF
jgi:hypothetical protein